MKRLKVNVTKWQAFAWSYFLINGGNGLSAERCNFTVGRRHNIYYDNIVIKRVGFPYGRRRGKTFVGPPSPAHGDHLSRSHTCRRTKSCSAHCPVLARVNIPPSELPRDRSPSACRDVSRDVNAVNGRFRSQRVSKRSSGQEPRSVRAHDRVIIRRIRHTDARAPYI